MVCNRLLSSRVTFCVSNLRKKVTKLTCILMFVARGSKLPACWHISCSFYRVLSLLEFTDFKLCSITSLCFLFACSFCTNFKQLSWFLKAFSPPTHTVFYLPGNVKLIVWIDDNVLHTPSTQNLISSVIVSVASSVPRSWKMSQCVLRKDPFRVSKLSCGRGFSNSYLILFTVVKISMVLQVNKVCYSGLRQALRWVDSSAEGQQCVSGADEWQLTFDTRKCSNPTQAESQKESVHM